MRPPALRAANWARQKSLGVTVIPSNDFSLYDHVLDTSVMVGAIPDIYGWNGGPVALETYFAMARGAQGDGHERGLRSRPSRARRGGAGDDQVVRHQLPLHGARISHGPDFQARLRASRSRNIEEAKALGFQTRPVLLGPVTFLKLGKSADPAFDPLSLLDRLLPVYIDVLQRARPDAAPNGCRSTSRAWFSTSTRHAATRCARPMRASPASAAAQDHARPPISARSATISIPRSRCRLPGFTSIWCARQSSLNRIVSGAEKDLILSLGVVDGRNVWRSDLAALLERFEPAVRETRRGSCADCAVMLAAARADRPRT